MIDQLPYTLTTGVTATREGLVMRQWMVDVIQQDTPIKCRELKSNTDIMTNPRHWSIPWPDAAERLLYREGGSWCYAFDRNIVCGRPGVPELAVQIKYTLHRLAAILCDDSESFRVLHWCINNLA